MSTAQKQLTKLRAEAEQARERVQYIQEHLAWTDMIFWAQRDYEARLDALRQAEQAVAGQERWTDIAPPPTIKDA